MNSDTKRFVLAILLSGFVLIGWQYLFPTQAPNIVQPKEKISKQVIQSIEKTVEQDVAKANVNDKKIVVAKKPILVADDGRSIVIDNNLNIHDFIVPGQMHTFSETIGQPNPLIVSALLDGSYRPLEFELSKNNNEIVGKSRHGITLSGKFLPNGKFSISLLSKVPLRYKIELRSQAKRLESNLLREFIYYSTEAERIDVGDDEVGDAVMKWFALDFNYHLFATVLKNKTAVRYSSTKNGVLNLDIVNPTDNFSFDFVFLKKNYDDLIAAGDKLEMSVDFGFFGIIAVPMLRAMQWLYNFIPNYGIAIIILTLLMRLVLYPLQHKSAKSMKKMQNLQPELQKIKQKYKDDQQRVQKETMELFKRNNANPMGGCLPLLLQMPVFFAIYRVLYSAVELVDAPFFGWITDLSSKDPYYVFPVLLTVVMFLQQKMMPSATTDPNQKKIMMAMPLIFGFIMKDMPSGLVLYIFVSTFFAIIQQFLTNKFSD